MATIREWEDSLNEMSEEEVEEIEDALAVLKNWDTFENSYSEMSKIRLIVRNHCSV